MKHPLNSEGKRVSVNSYLSSEESVSPSDGLGRASTPFSVSVVIPVYNGGEIFESCLASVAAALGPKDEIVVVADGESDGAWRKAAKFGARVIMLEKNGGPGRARNHGVRAARNDVIFFVDADVTIPPDALRLIAATFAGEPTLSAVIGSYDAAPGQTNFLSQYKNLLHHYVHQRGSTKASTFWGACGAIKRSVFLEVGGFAERFTRASIEDIELGYRLTDAGHAIRLVKELQITHHKRWTIRSLLHAEIFLRGKPWTRLLWRQLWWNGKLEADLNLDKSHRWSLLASVAALVTLLAGFLQPWLWLLSVPLLICFLVLNRSVLKFFYEQRGPRFAAGAAFWRLCYDLYSFLAFFLGSSDSAQVALRRLGRFTFARVDGIALGVAVGVVAALGLFLSTTFVIVTGHGGLFGYFSLLGQFLPGYRVTAIGACLGSMEAFALGFASGWLFAVVRNLSVRFAMGSEKVERATMRLFKARFPRPKPSP